MTKLPVISNRVKPTLRKLARTMKMTVSLFLQFQLRGVKYAGTGNDTSQFKGALTHADGC